jgi:hypothetical protein
MSVMTCLNKGAVAGLALMLLGGPASADIVAFNAAVQAGDYRAASLEASTAWPSVDKASPDAAAIAREFGWAAMLAGDPSSALVYARFLVERGASLPHPDPAPAVSRVLFDWASLKAASSAQSRVRLLASLHARATVAGQDLISVRASQALQAEAWSAADWSQAEGAAMLALRFLDDLGVGETAARYEARRHQHTANFMRTKSPDAYNALYAMVDQLHEQLERAGAERDRLSVEYFKAVGWADAAYAAMSAADRRQTPDRRQTAGAGQKPIAELLYPAPGDASLPRCRLVLGRSPKTPGFPFVSRFRDFGGVVTYALEVRPNGAFANPRLLAAAPHADFGGAVQDVVGSWTWRVEGQQPPACRMPQVHILTFEFAIGR